MELGTLDGTAFRVDVVQETGYEQLHVDCKGL